MDDGAVSVPIGRVFWVSEPPFLVEGMIRLDRIAGRGIQSEGDSIVQRWVLDFLDDVSSIGFENAASKWAREFEEPAGPKESYADRYVSNAIASGR